MRGFLDLDHGVGESSDLLFTREHDVRLIPLYRVLPLSGLSWQYELSAFPIIVSILAFDVRN